MQTVLTVLADELRRLKAAGVESVSVSDEALEALRGAVKSRAAAISRPQPARSPQKVERADPSALGGAAGPAKSSKANALGSARSTSETPASPAKDKARSTLPPPPTVVLPPGTKAGRWAALCALVESDATCRAHVRPGKKLVVGVGNLDARIMFVGEAPGADEEVQGEPFVGPAGQLLNRMIVAMGLQRADVYIGNIMNWRPELPVEAGAGQIGNRPPTAEEMAYCLPYLRAQIDVVAPELIVALGTTAAQALLGAGTFGALGQVRGQWKEFGGRPLIVTYHPSYILRNPTQRSKRMIWEDFLKVMARAGLPISEKQQRYFLDT